MNNISIRPANLTDIKSLQDLNDEIFIDNHNYDPDLRMDWAQAEDGGKRYFTDLVNNPEAICLIAVADNQPIGYIAASPKEINYRNSKYIEIENMGVNPANQSQGIGSQLMNQCLQFAKEKGYQKVYINCYFQNTKAVNFYRRNGFSEIDICLEKTL